MKAAPRYHRTYSFLLGSVLTILGLCMGPSAAQAQTAAPLPATTLQQINELLTEKGNRTPTQRKISSGLLHTAKAKLGLRVTANVQALASSVPVRDDGRVDVDIVGEITKPLIEALEAAGGEVLHAGLNGRVMRAAVPLEALEGLAAFNEVRTIHPAMRAIRQSTLTGRTQRVKSQLLSALERPRPMPSIDPVAPIARQSGAIVNVGAATSEGSKAHGADRARNWFGVNGAGVKIGVLSDSDDYKESSIGSGDLPADTITVLGQSGRPGSGEGTAMMEIVHDVAPGAKLFFASAFNGPQSFADNIRALRFTHGCDIIVDDVLYLFESPYQDDIVAKAVLKVIADGALYFSAAGNLGNLNDGTSGVWEGDFKKTKVPLATLPWLPDGYEVHDFGRGVVGNRVELEGGPLALHWADQGTLDNPHSGNDYDLFVLSPDLRSVAVAATDIQDGDDIPFEYLGFIIPAGYRVVIARQIGAADRALRVTLFNGELALATDGATYGHNSVAAAFGIAAVDVKLAAGGEFTGGATTGVELFSSDGPRRMFFDADGEQYNAFLTFKNGGGVTRRKPDVTAADGVKTTLPSSAGFNPFFGTSAAAPHAAAIASLLKSAKPLITQKRVRAALTKTAIDIEVVGRDRDSGFGIVNAFDALSFIKAIPKPLLELGPVTATPSSGDGDAFIEPGESADMWVTLVNNGGGAATNLNGTLTTSTPGVTIVSGASPWPDLATGAAASNTAPFAFNLDPTASCGVTGVFDLTTTFTEPGSPKTFTFSVPTGSPSQTPVAFRFTGPRVGIPDFNPAGVNDGVNIPLAADGVGNLSDVTFSLDGTTCTAPGIDHTWVGDIVMTLTSPAGTKVTLMERPGGMFNSGNNFCNTKLTDAADTSIQNITVGQAPYTGSFKPASPLSAFQGENGNGIWKLNVVDSAQFDTGGVRAFTLGLTGHTCTP